MVLNILGALSMAIGTWMVMKREPHKVKLTKAPLKTHKQKRATISA